MDGGEGAGGREMEIEGRREGDREED